MKEYPQYLVVIDGKEVYMSLEEASEAFSRMDACVHIGSDVLIGEGQMRSITALERQEIADKGYRLNTKRYQQELERAARAAGPNK